MVEFRITTGSVVLIRTAGAELVEVQLPEYVPPEVIVTGAAPGRSASGGVPSSVPTTAETLTITTQAKTVTR
jgi:hypothetical protein